MLCNIILYNKKYIYVKKSKIQKKILRLYSLIQSV